MRVTRRNTLGNRVVVAVLALAFVVVPTTGSNAAPGGLNLKRAQAHLDALNQRLANVDETYNQAVIALARTQRHRGLLQNEAVKAQKKVASAQKVVSAASVDEYIQGADSMMALMSASDVVSLVERLDFLDTVTSRNVDLALRASIAGRRAARLERRLQSTAKSETATLRNLGSMRAELQRGVAQAESLFRQIKAASPPRRTVVAASRSLMRKPLATSHGAQAAIDAAYSVIGTRYRYAGASPSEGFDCSGLTMWSWAHAGVSLPHSSKMQYESIPHVSRAELRPGDLVFFFHPISHVGMYVGNGQMIEAPHPGDVVKVYPIYWDSFVGAGRPGV